MFNSLSHEKCSTTNYVQFYTNDSPRNTDLFKNKTKRSTFKHGRRKTHLHRKLSDFS